MGRSGIWVSNLDGEAAYRSFRPAPLPPEPALEISGEMMTRLVEANRSLALLDMSSRLIPSLDLFVSLYIRKEALISSQIEGTQCTIDDIFDPVMNRNANADVADVTNYIQATYHALKRMADLPVCNRLLREIHAILMEGVRGEEKFPGEFRRSQNWIGPANCLLKDARFIPPNGEDMEAALSDLEKYINGSRDPDPLIRAALIHYQFETIHPFLDGNGRIGRLLILLYLMQQKLLHQPVLYVSLFLKKNQIEYYDRISEVRRSGNYEQWVLFFLEAVSAAAGDALESVEKLAALHETNIARLPVTGRGRDNVRMLFDYIEWHPIIDIRRTAAALSASYNTVSSAVRKLAGLGILTERTNAARNRVFAYEKYLEILRQDT